MKDRIYLEWLRDRFMFVHGENPGFDYMWKLQSIIEATPKNRETPNNKSIPDKLHQTDKQYVKGSADDKRLKTL